MDDTLHTHCYILNEYTNKILWKYLKGHCLFIETLHTIRT